MYQLPAFHIFRELHTLLASKCSEVTSYVAVRFQTWHTNAELHIARITFEKSLLHHP
jgi:hypothetical protein